MPRLTQKLTVTTQVTRGGGVGIECWDAHTCHFVFLTTHAIHVTSGTGERHTENIRLQPL